MAENLRVLFVEDTEPDVEIAVRQLQVSGVSCVHRVVDSEPDFRAALLEFRPHVILSDFTLPEFDGQRALDIAVKEAPDVPFIFLSGTIGEERAIEALHRGAVDYVLKTNLARLAPAVTRALRDVSERRLRRHAEQRIRESEQRLRDIIDTSQDWIWELDADGRYVFSSESVRDILGVAPQDLIGTSFWARLHEKDHAACAELLRALGPSRPTVTGAVARWRNEQGQYRSLEANVIALLTSDGHIAGFRGTHRDITERMRQQERIERLSRVLRMQSGINSAVVRIRDQNELLQEACRLAIEVGGYDRALVALVDPNTRRARIRFRAGIHEDFPHPDSFEIGDGSEPDTSLAGRALRTGEVAVCSDLTQSEPPVAMRQRLIELGYRSIVALPLIVDSERIGAVTLASRDVRLVRDEELSLLQDITANLSFALRSQHREDAVQFLASFDALTGLAKRSLFCERLTRLLGQRTGPEENPAVVAFDVHHLSNINDSFGRHVGDLVLQGVADRLRHYVVDDDHTGYLGSGTFVMVVPQQQTSEENIAALLESTVFREPFAVEGRSLRISSRSGIARYPADSRESSMLVEHAEAALKRAKQSGEQYLHYQVQMHSELAERLALEHKLRDALDQEQFVLYYQPQMDIATGRIVGVEALLRWLDPEEGLVAPARFLGILESSGMIVPVGNWVLRQAADDCRAWRTRGIGPVRVAVNVSSLQIRRRSFVESVLGVVGSWADGGYGLDLEITESGLLEDIEGASRKLNELREAGVRIAIDDFGTGYSSLGLLSRLPIDVLKIDRSFIRGLPADPASVTLVSSVISIASAFKLVSVAEGVETAEQFELLRDLKCHHSQGYLHSRPVPAGKFELLLRAQRAGTPS